MLVEKRLIFKTVDPLPVRDVLSTSGFCADWRAKFGDKAWDLLEQATGKLS
ncbi:hypothetical protein [Xanthobacter flavus]|uniref:hypothetical protein n=1 Tax=Xanthobacter flavus TaxID=281 RepID=UPI001AE405EE|nr:hypothetical protein [Xanthobacter flavus]